MDDIVRARREARQVAEDFLAANPTAWSVTVAVRRPPSETEQREVEPPQPARPETLLLSR